MNKDNSLLNLLLESGFAQSHSSLIEHLATQGDIEMPTRGKLASYCHQLAEQMRANPPAFKNNAEYMTRYFINRARERFPHLNFSEACAADDYCAVAAHIVGPDYRPDLAKWLHRQRRIHSLPDVRMVIIDSDLTVAGAILGDKSNSVVLSTDLIERLPERQLKAIISHELGHIRDGPPTDQAPHISYPREYRADAFAAKMTSADDMADGLAVVYRRNIELQRFAQRLDQLLREHGVPWCDMPIGLRHLEKNFNRPFRLDEDHDPGEKRPSDAHIPLHPPAIARFERLAEIAVHQDRRKPYNFPSGVSRNR